MRRGKFPGLIFAQYKSINIKYYIIKGTLPDTSSKIKKGGRPTVILNAAAYFIIE